jgi:hypothetical protein
MRAAALAARDEAAVRLLTHPGLQWTGFQGEVLDYEAYIAGNARGDLRWRSQRLEGIRVTVAGTAAVLTATTPEQTRQNVAEVSCFPVEVPAQPQVKGISVGFFVRAT